MKLTMVISRCTLNREPSDLYFSWFFSLAATGDSCAERVRLRILQSSQLLWKWCCCFTTCLRLHLRAAFYLQFFSLGEFHFPSAQRVGFRNLDLLRNGCLPMDLQMSQWRPHTYVRF